MNTKKSPVKDHVRHTHPSKKHPGDGCDVIVHSECRANPSKKDELSYAEIQRITDCHFHGLSGIKSGVPAFLKRFAQEMILINTFLVGQNIGMKY